MILLEHLKLDPKTSLAPRNQQKSPSATHNDTSEHILKHIYDLSSCKLTRRNNHTFQYGCELNGDR